MQHIAEY